MPRAELDALQEEKLLGDLLPWAYQRSPLIRETWDAAGVTPDDITTYATTSTRRCRSSTRTRSAASATSTATRTAACCASTSTRRRCVRARSSRPRARPASPTPAPYAGRGPSMLAREFWELGGRPGDHFTHMLFTFRGPGIHDTIRGIGATPIFLDHHPDDVAQLVRFSRELRPTGWYSLSGPLILAIEAYAAQAGVDLGRGLRLVPGRRLRGRAARATGPAGVVEGWGLELFVQTGAGRRRRRHRVPRARRLSLLGGHRVRRGARSRRHRARAPMASGASWCRPRSSTRSRRWCAIAPTTSCASRATRARADARTAACGRWVARATRSSSTGARCFPPTCSRRSSRCPRRRPGCSR